MKRRALAAMLAALLLPGCGTAGSASSSQEAPEAPIVIETLALELPAGGDNQAAQAFADSLPEAMAALGVEIPGNRLGLGANLFSDEPTLCESMGTEELADQIKQTNNYYNKHFLYGKNKA